MKTVKSSKEITTLEIGDKVVFGDLEYSVCMIWGYFLNRNNVNNNDKIFQVLNINKRDFVKNLGITANCNVDFPEVKSLEALTAIVSALFKEYEKQQNKLPKTWEEFCIENIIREGEEYYINNRSEIILLNDEDYRSDKFDRNVCASKQEAEAHLALMQLRQLRKAYVKDWEPDYKQQYYGIISNIHGLDIMPYTLVHKSMSFPTYQLAKQFRNNFKDLLEVAKHLL